MTDTRAMIRDFNLAFGRPVNTEWTDLTVSERELLGKLLLEETLEYCTKGLGLRLVMANYDPGASDGDTVFSRSINRLKLELDEGERLDPAECVDGLADVNVVAHFAAHWQGFDLDRATEIVNDSNMSKLGADGKPIINDGLIDPSKPVGKILKGPNFFEPQPLLLELIRRNDHE